MNNQRRLEIVEKLKDINLAYDKDLQQTVSYAARIFKAPCASINLLDKKVQWFKVKQGIDLDQVPRKLSFCTHAVNRKSALIINDLLTDKRFNTHPYVTGGPKVRFYTGMPLITREGHHVGTLCVMDMHPQHVTKQQKFVFEILGKHAISLMELKLSIDELDSVFKELTEARSISDEKEIRFSSMFNSFKDAYLLVGTDGEIIEFNQAAYNLVDNEHHVKITYGSMISDFILPRFKNFVLSSYKEALKGDRSEADWLADYDGKDKEWWHSVFEPVFNDAGEIKGVSIVARNINDQKQNEEKILKKNQLLTKIADIQSHEIRGPVASMVGLMNLIEEENFIASEAYLRMLQQLVYKLDDKIKAVVTMINHDEIN